MAACRCLPALLTVIFLAGISGQAYAQVLQEVRPLVWTQIDKPNINGETILAPSEINRLAASHDVVYALDTINSRLHRSDNGGLTFKEITAALVIAGAGLPGWEIAVAPDRPQYVAVVTDNRKRVYLSDDSGAIWYAIPDISLAPDEQIQCIAISNGYLSGTSLTHDMAVGTARWSSPDSGKLWTYQIGSSFGSWADQNVIPVADVSAVTFSPRYSSDSTLLAVVVGISDNTTYLCLGARDLYNQTTTWNGATGYPIPFVCMGNTPLSNDASGSSRILSYISLPSDYGGTDAKTRLAFVGYNSDNSTPKYNDIYRIDDDASPQVQRLNVAGGAAVDISSIAYFGTLASGKLLAGLTAPNPALINVAQVKWTISPLGTGTVGSTVWHDAYQPPSGPGNAQVAWSNSGSVAFCGTGQNQPSIPAPPPPGPSFDESAFSQSLDNGDTWVQTSLINTNLFMCDIAPAPDSRSLFMATYSEFGPESVWRCAGEPLGRYWGRLLNMPSDTNRVILRLSPDYRTDYTIYAIEVDNQTSLLKDSLFTNPSNLLQISENRGNTWKKRLIPRPVIDVVTAGRYTLYLATSGGCVRKSTDGGITWGDKVQTYLDNINMLAASDDGSVFAGSREGWVAYSTDSGGSFTKIPYPVTITMRDVQVVADVNYSSNHIIYASGRTFNGVDAGVWRWVIGQSTSWEQIDEEITSLGMGEQVSGLKVGPEGTLYVERAEPVKPVTSEAMAFQYSKNCTIISDNHTGGINRTLNPADLFYLIEWDIVNHTLADNLTPAYIAFDPVPLKFAGNVPWLKFSGNAGENDLWAIDTANGANDNTTGIFIFRDNVCKAGPWTSGPDEVGCDPVSGRNQGLGLSWEQLSLSDSYSLQIAKDPDFLLKIDPKISSSDNVSSVVGSIIIRTDSVSVTSPALWLNPGALPEAGSVYYWRVRTCHAVTGEFIRSPWSVTDGFLVKPGFPVAAAYYGPLLLSPSNECGCSGKAPVCFSWSPYKEATLYSFELSEFANMSRPLISVTADTTALIYIGQLKYGTTYFWRVKAVEPAPSDYSATFSFHTGSATSPAPATHEVKAVPLWAEISFILGTLAIVILLLLIFHRSGILP